MAVDGLISRTTMVVPVYHRSARLSTMAAQIFPPILASWESPLAQVLMRRWPRCLATVVQTRLESRLLPREIATATAFQDTVRTAIYRELALRPTSSGRRLTRLTEMLMSNKVPYMS